MHHAFTLKVTCSSEQPEAFLVTFLRSCVLEGLLMTQATRPTVEIVTLRNVATN